MCMKTDKQLPLISIQHLKYTFIQNISNSIVDFIIDSHHKLSFVYLTILSVSCLSTRTCYSHNLDTFSLLAADNNDTDQAVKLHPDLCH